MMERTLFLCSVAAFVASAEWKDDGNFHPLHVKPWDVFPELLERPLKSDLPPDSRQLQASSDCDSLAASDRARFSPPCCGTADDQEPCCEQCYGMTTCSILNGFLVEDRYYPTLTNLGSCENTETRVERLDIFGPGRTFRDLDICRGYVYEYICLFWASDAVDIVGTQQYKNRCPAVLNDATGDLMTPPKYPCRSFCTQVAQLCAQHDTWIQNCELIACPPIDEDCTPGPFDVSPDQACLIRSIEAPVLDAAPNLSPTLTLSLALISTLVAAAWAL